MAMGNLQVIAVIACLANIYSKKYQVTEKQTRRPTVYGRGGSTYLRSIIHITVWLRTLRVGQDNGPIPWLLFYTVIRRGILNSSLLLRPGQRI
ncbi:hypothetical protein BKA93DRAFT_777897 [Sparassis latifolia]